MRPAISAKSLRWINGASSEGCWIAHGNALRKLAATAQQVGGGQLDEARDRMRLAIAALPVPDRLCDAVSELFANQFSAADLCLAGAPAAIDLVRGIADTASGHPLTSLLEVEPVSLGGRARLLATSNRPLTTLKKSLPPPPGSTTTGSCWLPLPARDALMDHVANGDILVLAGPLAPSQLALATRVLLRHSQHPVQSHLIANTAWPLPPDRS